MKIRNICIAIIFCLLSLMVLVGCQMEAPEVTAEPSLVPVTEPVATIQPQGLSITGESIFPVSTVDEFLAAIGNNRVIALQEGVYALSTATDYGSDLIFMGAYGHSRMRQWIMGGASKTLLNSMTVPVMLSH